MIQQTAIANAVARATRSTTIALGTALVLSPPAWAQGVGGLEEVVVTAQKRAQSAQDLGLSVAAFAGEDLRERGLGDLESVLAQVPGTGFYDVSGGGVPVLVVRGVGLQNFRINDTPTTAVYVDDVYQTSVAMAATALFDLDRMEVLKGPQGGLYGRNAVGGAVQVLTRAPSFEENDGYLSAGIGRFNRLELEGGASTAFSDQWAARLSGRYEVSDDTQWRSVPGGFDHGEADRWALRGQLRFRGESSDWVMKIESGEDQSETPLLRPIAAWEPLGLNLVPGGNIADGAVLNVGGGAPSLDSVCAGLLSGQREPGRCETIDGTTSASKGVTGVYDSASLFEPRLDNHWLNVSLRGEIDLGEYTLTSITGYSSFDHGRLVDLDAVETVQQHIDYTSEITMWSQEFRLAYVGDGPLSWILGASYAEDELDEDSLLSGDTGLLPLALGGLTRAQQPYTQETDAWAVFGHGEYALSESLNLVFEARYTDEEKSLVGGVFLPEADFFLTFTDDRESYSAATGKVALEYLLSEDALAYVSVARGFKSGGFFGGFATDNAQLEPFDDESILSYELGVKTDWPEARARLNASVYYYDRQDVQASGFDARGAVGVQRLTNVGDAEVYGAELEGSWAPTDRLSMSLGLAWVESEITDSDVTTADIFLSTTAAPFEGAELPNQPAFSASFVGAYAWDLGASWGLRAELEYFYRDEQDLKIIVIPEERGVATEDAYGLLNLRLALSSNDGRYGLTAFVDNATDEEYRVVATKDDLGGLYEIYGNPRLWGIRAEYRF